MLRDVVITKYFCSVLFLSRNGDAKLSEVAVELFIDKRKLLIKTQLNDRISSLKPH